MTPPADEGARRRTETAAPATDAPTPASATRYGLTEDELALFPLFRQFWKGFNALPQLHPADCEEVAYHLHALSRIIGMRAAHRAHPDVIPNRSGTPI